MAITKTNFINYLRCPRYCTLDDLKHQKLDADVSYEEYREEELESAKEEILSSMYEEDGTDLIDVDNPQLKIMMPYYSKVEQLAGVVAPKYFKGTFKFAADTKMQESFDALINGIRYICYVDIYNEVDNHFNVIEVKATTSKKYMALGPSIKGTHMPILEKGLDGIYYFLEDLGIDIESRMPRKKYDEARMKLFDRFTSVGHYVYDLAVQRYIIEHDLKEHHGDASQIKYYLAVLDGDYTFDGTYDGIEPVYNTDENGYDIVRFIDMTSITKDYMDIIDIDRKKVETYVTNMDAKPCPLGIYCEYKKTTKCKYKDVCWKDIPATNSVFNYIGNSHGFETPDGAKYSVFDLANQGYHSMGDVPDKFLNKEAYQIQKNCFISHKQYIKLDKIEAGVNAIRYPIYHLDFETFPCPVPRFRGEHCYSQSVFQFSLHIEREPGVCDKEKDHYGYLAKDHIDHREDLIKEMIKDIDTSTGGSVLVYNQNFEKSRLKELSVIFPEYRKQLLAIRDNVYDLMFVLKGNSELYKNLGFEDTNGFNFYDYRMTGSFSIKKILPLFSNVDYHSMEIGNGVQAYTAYEEFPKLTPKDFNHRYQKLIEYCQQDTWSMVDILRGLREFIKNSK
jgi:hypothetical protein